MASRPFRPEHARARRAFGQNLLSDSRAVETVVSAAEIKPTDLVYEVGAGRGRITRALLDRGAHVVAFEVDPAMAAALPRHSRLEVRAEDFLAATPPGEPFSVVGNIPYALTSPVVDWCLRAPSMTGATLVTQWEYARKRTGDYGRWTRLTIATWPTFDWELGARISRAAFRPVPRVDGAVLRVVRLAVPLVGVGLLPAYEKMVDCGFEGVGGSLGASLKRRFGATRADGALRAARLGADVPVGRVWPEQWLTLFRILQAGRQQNPQAGPSRKGDRHAGRRQL